jgi:hypothetical protein
MHRASLFVLLVSAAVACGTTIGVRDVPDAATEHPSSGDAAADVRDSSTKRVGSDAGSDSSSGCLKLGAVCQIGASCCEGSCEGTTTCRLGPGDPCNADEDWCGAALECDRKTSTCAFVTCFENNKNSTLCNMFPNIGCCDETLVCESLGKLAGYGCCIPSGGAVIPGAPAQCCSQTTKVADGGLVCD